MPSGGSFRRLGIFVYGGPAAEQERSHLQRDRHFTGCGGVSLREEEANFYNFTVDTDPQILRAFEVVDTLTGRNDIQASLEPSQSSSASEAGGAGSSLQSEPAGTDASSAAEPAA